MKRIRRNAKTIRPEPAEYFLPREGLVQKLSRSGKKLMILSAPSGYGKTALMELYARSSEAPSVWYRLDGNDNTASLFLESFTVSLEAAVSGFSWNPEQVQRVQGLEHPLEEDDFYQRIGRELAYTLKRDLGDDPLDLMLDDSQTLDSRPVFSILSGLTDALPGNVRILISTRGRIPGFALRFLAAGEALVLSGGELAFSLEETAEVFSGLETGERLESLTKQIGGFLEGWPAGTLLLYRYLKEKGSFLARGSVQELCRRAGVYDLMSWEVLSRLSPELKQFLERISVLDRLTWGSCQAVSGMEKGKELMEETFSVGLLNWDSGEKEPSGHMLLAFRIVLLEQMDEGERRQRCGLAARYYLDSECGELAADYSVRARSGALFSEAAEKARASLLETEDHERLKRWLSFMDSMESEEKNLLPGAFLTAACCQKAMGDSGRALEYLQRGMRKAEAAGMKNAYAELMARKLQWMLEMGKGREAVREGAEISAAGSLPLGKEWILLEYVRLKCLLFCGAFGEAGRLAGKLAEADEGWADPKALEVSGVRRKAEWICQALADGGKGWRENADFPLCRSDCPEVWDIRAARQILKRLERLLDEGGAADGSYEKELELAGILKRESAGSFASLAALSFTGLLGLGTDRHEAALQDLDLVFRQARRLYMDPGVFPEKIRELLYRLMLARERGYQGGKGKYNLFVVCFGSFRTMILETGEEVRWRSRKVRECMAFLTLNGARGFTREELLETLWDEDHFPSNEIASFHNLLSSIRRSLASWNMGDLLVFDGKKYSLKPGRVYTEMSRGEDLVAAAMAKDAERIRSMQASLFRFADAPFLSRKSSGWISERRNFYEIWFARCLVYLGETYRKEGRPETAALAFQKALELSPYMEQAQTGLLMACGDQGSIEKLRRAYKRIGSILKKDMEEVPEGITETYKEIVKNVRISRNAQKCI